MFGIIYTLLGLGAYGKGLIRQGIHDAKSAEKALNANELTYQDFRGHYREIGSNDQVMFEIEPLSQDWGYRIIDHKSKNRNKFVNISEIQRNAQWKKYHQAWISGNPIVDDPDYPPETVIEWERPKSNFDNKYYIIGTTSSGKTKYNKPRKCRGRRYKDIETGRMLVEREGGGDKKFIYYMDAETGEPVRLSDRQEKKFIDHPGLFVRAEIEEKLKNEKKDYEREKTEGLAESDPDWFFRNYFLTAWG